MKKLSMIVAVVVLFLVCNTGVQADVNVELVGQWGGDCDAVAISGNLAYIGLGPSLVILDISEPNNPVKLGKVTLPDMVEDIAVSGSYAYVADHYAGLQIIDVSNASSPVCVGSFDGGGFAGGVAIAGSYAYVVGWSAGLQIIDVSNPAKPMHVAWYDTPSHALDVAIAGSCAYVAGYNTGLQIIDISDPTNPSWLGACDTSGIAWDIAVSGDYAYVADFNDGLKIINVSDPCNPELAAEWDIDGLSEKVEVAGNLVYLGGQYIGLQIIDVSDPANPVWLGEHESRGTVLDIAVVGNYTYIGDWRGLQIIDVYEPANPVVVGEYKSSGSNLCIAIVDNYAYLGGWDGLKVIDVGDPAEPKLIGWVSTPNLDLLEVEIAGSYAYAACQFGGLHIIDIFEPTNPIVVGDYGGIIADDVAVADNYAYVTARSEGLHILDVSNPYSPVLVCSIESYASHVAVKGNYAYVTGDGLKVYDISNPTSPQLVGSNEALGGNIFIYGDYAYLSTGYGKLLKIVNISNPSFPIAVYDYPTWECAWDTFVVDDRAYIADGNPGIQVVDISDPCDPIKLGQYNTCYAIDLVVRGDYIYVADNWGGLAILAINSRPVADAGPDQTAYAWIDGIAEVVLDGNDSYDPDGDELSYYWSWTIDSNNYEANGVNPTIELPVGEHTVNLIVNDGIEDSEPNEVVITVIEPIESALRVMPRTINRRSRQRLIRALLRLPEDIAPEQIDNGQMLMLYPGEIEANRQRVFQYYKRDIQRTSIRTDGCGQQKWLDTVGCCRTTEDRPVLLWHRHHQDN